MYGTSIYFASIMGGRSWWCWGSKNVEIIFNFSIMVYAFYVFGLISFAISNHIGFMFLIQYSNIWFVEAFFLSSFITGFLYGCVLHYVLKSVFMMASIRTVKQMIQINTLSKKDTNNPIKSGFSDIHKEKLRQKSLKRTRDANWRFV